MKLADVISAIKTELEGLSWSSDSGGGTTSLQTVKTYPDYENSSGSPFACIHESEASGSLLTVQNYQIDTRIYIDICVNWSVVSGDTTDEKREECLLRLREAWDYLKTQIYTKAFIDSVGIDILLVPGFQIIDYPEINVRVLRLTLSAKEYIAS